MGFKDLKGFKIFEIHSTSCHQFVIINVYGRIHVGILRFQIKDFKIHRGVRSMGAMEARAPPKFLYVLDDFKKIAILKKGIGILMKFLVDPYYEPLSWFMI